MSCYLVIADPQLGIPSLTGFPRDLHYGTPKASIASAMAAKLVRQA
jgi:hypothetical protein